MGYLMGDVVWEWGRGSIHNKNTVFQLCPFM